MIAVEIPGFEGIYSVTMDGRVFSHPRTDARGHKRDGKFLKLIPDGDGYLRAHLCVNAVKRKWPVHRLVAMTFLPNSENLPEVNHLDGVKTNNEVRNLEWCTTAENQRHARATGLIPVLKRKTNGQFEALQHGNI